MRKAHKRAFLFFSLLLLWPPFSKAFPLTRRARKCPLGDRCADATSRHLLQVLEGGGRRKEKEHPLSAPVIVDHLLLRPFTDCVRGRHNYLFCQ